MDIRVVPATALRTEELLAWAGFQEADPALASPFFRPEFTQAVAAVRDDVRVGVMEESGHTVGFFPFQLLPDKMALPVGTPMSDYQGVIARRGTLWDAPKLLAACGLLAWRFDRLVASQAPFGSYQCVRVGSPYIDLSGGFAAYRETFRARGSKLLNEMARKARQAERQYGPMRFVPRVTDPQVFQTLQEWKRRQLGEASADDTPRWMWQVRERIFRQPAEGFSGILSALYFGDRVAALQFNLRSRDVLQGWVTSYDPEFARYSPGMILVLELTKMCESLGIRRIEMGRGSQDYKMRLMTGETPVAEGTVDLRLLRGALWRVWLRTHDWVRHSRLRPVARRINRALGDPRARLGLDPCNSRRLRSCGSPR